MPVTRPLGFSSCKASAITTWCGCVDPLHADPRVSLSAQRRAGAAVTISRRPPHGNDGTRRTAALCGPRRLICGEAVKQAVASGAPQIVLAAAAVGAARGV